MQTPLIGKCEQFIGGSWVDVSSRVSWMENPISISRGLSDSGDPTPGSMTLVMKNDDGAITPGLSAEIRRNCATIPCPTSTTGWSSNNAALYVPTFDATGGRRGTGARLFTRAASSPSSVIASCFAAGLAGWTVGDRVSVTPDDMWITSVYVKADVIFTASVSVGFFDASNVQVGSPVTGSVVTGAANTWAILTVAAVVPAGATNFGIQTVLVSKASGSTVGGEQVWMCDALYEKTTIQGAYFDGTYSPEGVLVPAWTGAVGTSVSTLSGVGASLTRWRPIRLNVWANSAYRQRFYGFVDSEALSWPTGDAAFCQVTLTAVDLVALAAVRTLRSVAVEATAAKSPIAYWPLTDAETLSAADQSGNRRPGLDVQQQGTGGAIGWGSGTALRTDLTNGLTFTPASDNGVYLASPEGIDLPAAWSLSVWISPAAKDGYVCQVGSDGYQIGIWYDTSTQKLSAVETVGDEDSSVDYVLSTTTATWSPGIETLTVTATTVKLGSSGTTGTRHNSDQMVGSRVSVGGSLTDPPSRQQMYSGEVKHLAIWSGAVPANTATDILTGPSGLSTVSGIITEALSWAGLSGSVTTRGTNQAAVLPSTEGATVASLMGDLGRGSLARVAANLTGGVNVTAWDYSPTPVAGPAGEIDPDVEWVANPDADVTQATMVWPDGGSYTVTDSPDRPVDLPGVLPMPAGRSVAEWVVNAPVGDPRLPDAGYDLLTLPDATVAALCTLDVGDLLTASNLPPQLPSASQTSIVDSFTETVGANQWSMRMATSPDPRSQLMIVGDATRGVVGAGYLTAPLGTGRSASGVWLAGEAITAAALNSRQYSGTMVQSGTVTISPGVANTNNSTTVTFPTAFPTTPKVVVVQLTSVPWTVAKGYCVSSVSTTGFTAWAYRTDVTAPILHWLAVV